MLLTNLLYKTFQYVENKYNFLASLDPKTNFNLFNYRTFINLYLIWSNI